MKIVFLILPGLLLAGCSPLPSANTDSAANREAVSPARRGSEIIGEYLKRDAAPFRKSRVRLTTFEDGKPQEVFEIDTWRKQTEGETKTLTQIVRPAEDTDLASLTVETKGRPTRVSSYVASRGEFRETDTNKMFFGGLTAGELLGEWDKFDYKYIGEKNVDGQKVYELEGTLKKDESSLIQRMTITIRADSFVPVELRLYDSGGRHIRTYRVVDVKTDAKGSYASRTEVENLIYNNKTVIEVLSREFPAAIDDTFFARDKLKQIATGRK